MDAQPATGAEGRRTLYDMADRQTRPRRRSKAYLSEHGARQAPNDG